MPFGIAQRSWIGVTRKKDFTGGNVYVLDGSLCVHLWLWRALNLCFMFLKDACNILSYMFERCVAGQTDITVTPHVLEQVKLWFYKLAAAGVGSTQK